MKKEHDIMLREKDQSGKGSRGSRSKTKYRNVDSISGDSSDEHHDYSISSYDSDLISGESDESEYYEMDLAGGDNGYDDSEKNPNDRDPSTKKPNSLRFLSPNKKNYFASDNSNHVDKYPSNNSTLPLSIGSNHSNNGGAKRRDSVEEVSNPQETSAIRMVRVFLVVVMVSAVIGIGLGTYFWVSGEEKSDFQAAYDMIATDMDSFVDNQFGLMIDHLATTSIDMTSQAISLQEQQQQQQNRLRSLNTYYNETIRIWPEVTLRHFDQKQKHASAHPFSSTLSSSSQGEQKDSKKGSFHFVLFAPIVSPSDESAWEEYSVQNQGWIDEDLQYRGWNPHTNSIPSTIYNFTSSNEIDSSSTSVEKTQQVPLWQLSPPPQDRSIINLNLQSIPTTNRLIQQLTVQDSNESKASFTSAAISSVLNDELRNLFVDTNDDDENKSTRNSKISVESILAVPVYDTFYEESAAASSKTIVGFVFGIFSWENLLQAALSTMEDKGPVQIILREAGSCHEQNTSSTTTTAAPGPSMISCECINNEVESLVCTHQEDLMGVISNDQTAEYFLSDSSSPACGYTMSIRATPEMEDNYHTNEAMMLTIISVSIIVFIGVAFFYYDHLVQGRHRHLMIVAQRAATMLSSLFPKDVQRRIMAEADDFDNQSRHSQGSHKSKSMTGKMADFLDEEKEQRAPRAALKTKPIADLFPEATIIFADLVGFTAWSSMREPSQVFTLLESIYHEFDEIARRRRVFKVETVGDCYVAVAGLPEPCVNHAQVMARFATDCRFKMNDLVKELEVTLGPDTADLAIRIGLHSGPVTAGVLRGDRARFQLFGDTVNTTSRLETTGKPDKIHCSQEFADLLTQSGKGHWLKLREDKVTAKGKGELTTYWLMISNAKRRGSLDTISKTVEGINESVPEEVTTQVFAGKLSDKHERLVNWITNELANLLKDIEIQRLSKFLPENADDELKTIQILENRTVGDLTRRPLDEVEEIIILPKYQTLDQSQMADFELDSAVIAELHTYVHTLATMYPNNPFHNFEHASHVTMSVVKLLSRIVAPDIHIDSEDIGSTLHDHTYGITSDPLTQFAVVLSALIHDVDHPGVPNSQLANEKHRLNEFYRNKSAAEQNSVDLAWEMLMQQEFRNLRSSIYSTEAEFNRFRKLIVNTVMATDIMDKDLGAARKARWNMAFSEHAVEDTEHAVNRKATIVIEHIIQASDIAHTMQHWHIYRKWNGRLFEEMYKAYIEGRAEKSPADNWYEGEIGFFKFYIIPLANKLKECGVFGVSSEEYLNYALQNLREWELNGKNVVRGMVESMKYKHTAPAALAPPALDRAVSAADTAGSCTTRTSLATSGYKPIQSINTFKTKDLVRKVSLQPESAPLLELPETMNVLFVDDDKITRKMFTRSVKKLVPQWEIRECASGEEALEFLSGTEIKFDLIFMDHYMGTDKMQLLGSDAVAELTKRGVTGKICGMSANDVEHLFDEAGADEFIFKPLPFREEPLKRELLRILSKNDFQV